MEFPRIIKFALWLLTIIAAAWLITIDPEGEPPEWAYYAAAESTLKNLATAQEDYYSEAGDYTCDVQDLRDNFKPDSDVDLRLLRCSGDSWLAAATPDRYAAIFVYDASRGGLQRTVKEFRSAFYYWYRGLLDFTDAGEAHGLVKFELKKAAQAQEEYRKSNSRYAVSIADLGQWYEPKKSVLIRLARVDEDDFVLVGTHIRWVRLFSYDSAKGE